jgi:outer membrane protein assembly factor BamB
MTTLRLVAPSRTGAAPRVSGALSHLAPLFQDVSLFATLPEGGLAALTRDLAFALSELSSGVRPRSVVPTEAASQPDGPRSPKGAVWEVGLEREGDRVLVTVFRQGVRARVAQSERAVTLASARQAVLDAIAAQSQSEVIDLDGAQPEDRGLALAREQLLAFQSGGALGEVAPTSQRVSADVRSSRKSRLFFDATIHMRKAPRKLISRDVSRADLHALLFSGEFVASVGDSSRRLPEVHVFLVAEAFLALAHELLDAVEHGRSMLRQVNVGRVRCGVQLEAKGEATLLLALGEGEPTARSFRLPPVPPADLALAAASFARALVKQVTTADRSQQTNLRLVRLSDDAEELKLRLRAGDERDNLLNGTPESYRAFAASDTRPPPAVVLAPPQAGKLRFTESWRADIAGLDLRSIHLVGDRLLCASQREAACIERATGQLLWTQRTHRGVSIPTPVGLARLAPDGHLVMHDLVDGERLYDIRLGPCSGARTSGAVVSTPGLPHLLLLGEGERHLAAVDLDSSEIRWRRPMRREGTLRLRRAGKLMLATCGTQELSAIDILSGEIVWRHCAQGRYSHGVAIDETQLFAVTTTAGRALAGRPRRGEAVVIAVDPWTGAERWQSALPRPAAILGTPIVTRNLVLVVTDDGAEQPRIGVTAFDRATGKLRYDLPAGLAEGQASRLLVDDLLFANSETGELVAFDVEAGRVRYRHVFAANRNTADRPSSLQPVLRSGALFLPQTEVFVVRPKDGALLGRTAADLVPDAMLVDERCGVYVAEASGYLGAYHALPMLSLVEVP